MLGRYMLTYKALPRALIDATLFAAACQSYLHRNFALWPRASLNASSRVYLPIAHGLGKCLLCV